MATQHFSNTFLKEIKKNLLNEKVRLETGLLQFAKPGKKDKEDFTAEFPNYGSEVDDDVLEVEEFTVNKPLEITLEKTLQDITKALDRLEKGTYGICKYCKNPIDENRLQARPTSSACVSCKKVLKEEA
ncbi:MAG: TraR/DksA C4-type zinc finger protein [Patescibacteria group bacterium]